MRLLLAPVALAASLRHLSTRSSGYRSCHWFQKIKMCDESGSNFFSVRGLTALNSKLPFAAMARSMIILNTALDLPNQQST
jgi:hypothetical protein